MSEAEITLENGEWSQAGHFAHMMFQSSPVPSWVIDLDTMHFLDVNQAAIDRYGYNRDTFLSSELLLLRPNDSLDVLSEDYNKFAKNPHEWFERRHRAASGRWVQVSVRVQPIQYETRRAGMVVVQDYTTHFELQEKLARLTQRYESLLGSCPEAVILIDREGEVTGWTGSAERMFGYTVDEAAGKPMHELIMPERYRERHVRGLTRYVATGSPRIFGEMLDVPALRKSGEEFRVQLLIQRVEGIAVEFVGYLRELPVAE